MRQKLGSLVAVLTLIVGSLFIASPATAADFDFIDTPATMPLELDLDSAAQIIPVSGVGAITDVRVMVDFSKVSRTCAASGTWSAFSDEVSFSLTSPIGTTVFLIHSWGTGTPTYPNSGARSTGRVQVALDDDAALPVGVNLVPETGVFRPAEPLSVFDGENPNGDWVLTVMNRDTGDSLCYYGATLSLTDATTTQVPTPPGPTPPGPTSPGPTPPLRVETAAL